MPPPQRKGAPPPRAPQGPLSDCRAEGEKDKKNLNKEYTHTHKIMSIHKRKKYKKYI